MSTRGTRVRILITLAAGGLLAAGCASATSGAGAAPAGTATTTAGAATSPARVAEQDVAALLAAFPAPPGATRVSGPPDGTPAGIRDADAGGGTTAVTATDWWITAESATTTTSWLDTRAMRTMGSAGTGTGGGYRTVNYFARSTTVLYQREVTALIGTLPGGHTVIRVDAYDVYRPARPASETVPVSARLLVVARPAMTAVRMPSPGPGATTRVVTDRTKIARVAAIVNALPLHPPGVYLPCPMDNGSGIGLTFQAADGTTLATVTLDTSGCHTVAVTVGGRDQPQLDATATGPVSELESILGLPA